MSISVRCLALAVLVMFGSVLADEEEVQAKVTKCYSCSSILAGQEKCSEGDQLAEFERDCSDEDLQPKGGYWEQLKEENNGKVPAVGCRKIDQDIRGNQRVVRTCAYDGQNDDGVKRTGNKKLINYYYQCSSEDFCNGAGRFAAALLLPLILAALARPLLPL